MAASSFRRHLSPYSGHYVRHVEAGGLLFGNTEWRAVERPLTDGIINAAIAGQLLAAYYLAVTPRAFALDVDDHTGRGDAYLLAVYEQAVRALHARPSLLARSPHGLHAHYLLTWPVAWEVLAEQLRAALAGVPVEPRPTPLLALRVPARSVMVDPETLKPIRAGDFDDLVEAAVHHHPAVLFGTGILPDELRSSLAQRKGRMIRMRAATSLARVEAAVLPGESNAALCRLIPLYRSAGLSVEEAAARFASILAPVYDGELRSWPRLMARVDSFYRKRPLEGPYRAIQSEQPTLFNAMVAANVAAAWPDGPRAGQRRGTIERFVAGVLRWRDYVAGIRRDPSATACWDYMYTYFRKNTREGYTPLPQATLRRIARKGQGYMPWLEEIGFLERSPYGYSSRDGICRYFRVNDARFLGEVLPSPLQPPFQGICSHG